MLEGEGQVAGRPGHPGQPLVQAGPLAAAAPARLLDQLEQQGAGLLVAAALAQPLGQRRAQALVGGQQPHRLLQHRHRPRQQAELGVEIGRPPRAGDERRLVVDVFAALGEDAGQLLAGVGGPVQIGQHGPQLLGPGEIRQGPLEAGHRAVALAGRQVGPGQAGRHLAARLPLGHVEAPVQPGRRRREVPAGALERPQRVQRLAGGLQVGDPLPGRHRPRAGWPASARPAAPAGPTARPRARPRPGPPAAGPAAPAPRPAPRARPAARSTSLSLRTLGTCPTCSPRLARRISERAGLLLGQPLAAARSPAAAPAADPDPAPPRARPCAGRPPRRSAAPPRRGGPAPRAPARCREPRPAAAARSAMAPGRSASADSVSSAARLHPGPALLGLERRGAPASSSRAVARRTAAASPAATCRPTSCSRAYSAAASAAVLSARRGQASRNRRTASTHKPLQGSSGPGRGPAACPAPARRPRAGDRGCWAPRWRAGSASPTTGRSGCARCSSARSRKVGTWRGSPAGPASDRGRRRLPIVAPVEEVARGPQVQLAPDRRRQIRRLLGRLRQGRRRRPDPVGLARHRLVERQQHPLAHGPAIRRRRPAPPPPRASGPRRAAVRTSPCRSSSRCGSTRQPGGVARPRRGGILRAGARAACPAARPSPPPGAGGARAGHGLVEGLGRAGELRRWTRPAAAPRASSRSVGWRPAAGPGSSHSKARRPSPARDSTRTAASSSSRARRSGLGASRPAGAAAARAAAPRSRSSPRPGPGPRRRPGAPAASDSRAESPSRARACAGSTSSARPYQLSPLRPGRAARAGHRPGARASPPGARGPTRVLRDSSSASSAKRPWAA